jgi:hypothetical protein
MWGFLLGCYISVYFCMHLVEIIDYCIINGVYRCFYYHLIVSFITILYQHNNNYWFDSTLLYSLSIIYSSLYHLFFVY